MGNKERTCVKQCGCKWARTPDSLASSESILPPKGGHGLVTAPQRLTSRSYEHISSEKRSEKWGGEWAWVAY